MKVELLTTLKGRDDDGKKAKWSKGTIFDDNNGKAIPKCIKEEIAINSKAIRLLHDPKGNPIGETDAGEIERMKAELIAARETIENLRKELSDMAAGRKKTEAELAELKKDAARSQNETKPDIATNPVETTTNATGPTFTCPVPGCESGKIFSSENGLKMHITRVHPDVAEQYYQD